MPPAVSKDIDVALLVDIFNTVACALKDVPLSLPENRLLAEEIILSVKVLRNQRSLLATMDTTLADSVGDVVDILAEMAFTLDDGAPDDADPLESPPPPSRAPRKAAPAPCTTTRKKTPAAKGLSRSSAPRKPPTKERNGQ